MIKLGSLADLSSIREPISNVGNLTGRFCHRNFSLWKNEPKWLVLKSLNWLENRLLRRREQPISACLITPFVFSLFFLLSCFSLSLSISFYVSILPCFSVIVYYA